jgi:hypothetical protein
MRWLERRALAHLSDQLIDIERLRKNAEQRLRPLRFGGDVQICRHDDHPGPRRVSLLFQKMEHLKPIHSGHHQIEQDRSVIVFRQLLDGFESIASGIDLKFLPAENACDHRPDGVVVINDENLFTGVRQNRLFPTTLLASRLPPQWNHEPPLMSIVTPLR